MFGGMSLRRQSGQKNLNSITALDPCGVQVLLWSVYHGTLSSALGEESFDKHQAVGRQAGALRKLAIVFSHFPGKCQARLSRTLPAVYLWQEPIDLIGLYSHEFIVIELADTSRPIQQEVTYHQKKGCVSLFISFLPDNWPAATHSIHPSRPLRYSLFR